MTLPLMPKATVVWLIENTGLTFNQIAAFCGLHELEIEGIAYGDVATGKTEFGKLHPIGHVGEPMDIANGVLYLVSDEAAFSTGAELVIDGGYTAA